jgi:hypothetical protein
MRGLAAGKVTFVRSLQNGRPRRYGSRAGRDLVTQLVRRFWQIAVNLDRPVPFRKLYSVEHDTNETNLTLILVGITLLMLAAYATHM